MSYESKFGVDSTKLKSRLGNQFSTVISASTRGVCKGWMQRVGARGLKGLQGGLLTQGPRANYNSIHTAREPI